MANGYKYGYIWTESQSFVRLPTFESFVRLFRLGKTGIVRVNPCQLKLQKVACPNEVLSDYFMKFKSCEWSFVRQSYEIQIVKVKFCQYKLWMLYRMYFPRWV